MVTATSLYLVAYSFMIGLNCVKILIFSSFDHRWVSEMLLTSYYPCNIQTKIKKFLFYCDKYNSIVTVEEKLSVNLMKFRKIVHSLVLVIDGNL